MIDQQKISENLNFLSQHTSYLSNWVSKPNRRSLQKLQLPNQEVYIPKSSAKPKEIFSRKSSAMKIEDPRKIIHQVSFPLIFNHQISDQNEQHEQREAIINQKCPHHESQTKIEEGNNLLTIIEREIMKVKAKRRKVKEVQQHELQMIKFKCRSKTLTRRNQIEETIKLEEKCLLASEIQRFRSKIRFEKKRLSVVNLRKSILN